MEQFDFFVSHSSEDADKVMNIIKSLEKSGAKCWYAPRDVAGAYASSIVNGIRNSKVFLLCLSKKSARSDHVLNEIETAYNKRKLPDSKLRIEILRLEPIDLESPEYDDIMYYIRRINFISPTNIDASKDVAREILLKTKDCVKLSSYSIKKERTQSAYFTSKRETERLRIQTDLLRKFDGALYGEIFNKVENPDILDVGCGNGEMLLDRLKTCQSKYNFLGIEKDELKVQEGIDKFGNENIKFVTGDIEDKDFWADSKNLFKENGFEKFDIINVSMLLLHIKSECSLLRKLKRLLKPNGILVIKDIDDGLNFAYPDELGNFERVYEICNNNETSGDRKNGRGIYTKLHGAGFRTIELRKQGFSTIGLTYDEKEAFWDMYFKFILGDIRWMREKYPENEDVIEDCEWYDENYEKMFNEFVKDDFVFSLGFMFFTAQK